MNRVIKEEFWKRIARAKALISRRYYSEAFLLLEEAHVLGQSYVLLHTVSHYWMLRIGIQQKNIKEVFGQLVRIPSGAVGSFLGIVPNGNTGGANISAFKTLPIAEDLRKIMDSNEVQYK